MNGESAVLSCYETMAAASARMLDAARARDLDALYRAESECADMIVQLRALGQATGEGRALSAEGARRQMDIIRRLLADDAQIRELTQPWLNSLERLLGATAGQRKLHGAYG